jgi:hypothetical protein
MKSRVRSDRLDLERGLPTTAKDNAALRRVKTVRRLTLEEYLYFLDQLPPPADGEQRAKRGPRAVQPFAI